MRKKEIIGMIHLAGPDVINKAIDEIKIYEEEGISSIIIENYHGTISNVIELLEYLNINPTKMSVGINILPNEFDKLFDLCNKYEFIDFIQLDYISGVYQPNIELDEHKFSNKLVSCRPIRILGGVWPKYYTPVEGSDLQGDIDIGLWLADVIVVTGTGTGKETPLEKIRLFRELMDNTKNRYVIGKNKSLIVGAGLTPLNVREQLTIADGGIVGSAFKPNGRTNQMVDRDLVRKFMNEVNKL